MEGFWEDWGALWTLQGLFSVVSGLFWDLLAVLGLFLVFLAFPDVFIERGWLVFAWLGF